MKSKILSREFVKTIQAKVQVGREEGFPQFLEIYFKFVNIISLVMEQQGTRKMQNYRSKVIREDMGARAGLEGRRREESQARKNSIKNRKTSKVPVKCLSFNC